MSYSDFTFAKLKKNYGLEQEEANLFEKGTVLVQTPTSRLLRDIEDAKLIPLYSEKAKSEAIIFPIIREIKINNPQITVFSGYSFNIAEDKDLSGTPDFMISAHAKTTEPQSPIFCLFESKNKEPHEGFAQCAAEMYAARLFNRGNGDPYETIYGAVTNAYDWVFLKLEGDTVYIDKERYFLNQLPQILGIMQYIIDQYK